MLQSSHLTNKVDLSMSGNIIFNYSVSDTSSVLISDVSLFPSLNQEMWTDLPGGWWWLPVPCDHSIGASWWCSLLTFNQSRGTPSPGLHPVGLHEETMWQRVSRTTHWMILVTFDNISSIQQDFPCDFVFCPQQRSIRHRSTLSVPAHSPSHWRV